MTRHDIIFSQKIMRKERKGLTDSQAQLVSYRNIEVDGLMSIGSYPRIDNTEQGLEIR